MILEILKVGTTKMVTIIVVKMECFGLSCTYTYKELKLNGTHSVDPDQTALEAV